MSVPPLTHHEILGLVGPFTRAGRHVDLHASNRLERRLIFKPAEHASVPGAVPRMCEELELHSFGTGTCRLTRRVTLPCGLSATLEAMGPEPGELLQRIESIPLEHHFRLGEGFAVARSYALDPKGARGIDAVAAPIVLTRGVARVEGLVLTLSLSSTRGISADLGLEPAAGEALALPEDLLAVLGWDWARLVRNGGGWKTRLRVRGGPARRTRKAENALDVAAAHLATTLAEAPARFHERWLGARWGVVLRRSIPVLTLAAILAAVLTLSRFKVKQDPGMWMLLFHVPTVLIAASFCLQELAQYEIPPLPRPSGAAHWRAGAAAPSASEPGGLVGPGTGVAG